MRLAPTFLKPFGVYCACVTLFLGCAVRCKNISAMYQFPERCRGGAHAKHVAVIIPGLNNSGDSFNQMTAVLCAAGVSPVVIELTQQRGQREDQVAELWIAELTRSIDQSVSDHPGARLSVIGFSLGGTLALHYALTNSRPIEQLVLIAPALHLVPRSRFFLLASDLIPWNWEIPSLAPLGYRRSDNTPLADYRSTGELRRRVLRLLKPGSPLPPTIVVGRSSDPLIAEAATAAWASKNQIEYMSVGEPADQELNHHLLVDERSFGVQGWRDFTARLNQIYRNGS